MLVAVFSLKFKEILRFYGTNSLTNRLKSPKINLQFDLDLVRVRNTERRSYGQLSLFSATGACSKLCGSTRGNKEL